MLSQKGLIHYVVSREGHCYIKEINPQSESKDHPTVYEIKSDKCLGFCVRGSDYYFVDDQKIVKKLTRLADTGLFVEVGDYFMKQNEMINF